MLRRLAAKMSLETNMAITMSDAATACFNCGLTKLVEEFWPGASRGLKLTSDPLDDAELRTQRASKTRLTPKKQTDKK